MQLRIRNLELRIRDQVQQIRSCTGPAGLKAPRYSVVNMAVALAKVRRWTAESGNQLGV